MKKDRFHTPLARILVDAELCDAAWLEALPKHVGNTAQDLALYLEQRGLCHEEDILRAICRQKGYARSMPSDLSALRQGTPSHAPMFPESEARKACAVPLQRDGDTLQIATYTLPESSTLSHLELITDCEIRPILCTRSEYARLFRSLYGSESGSELLSAPAIPPRYTLSEDAAPYGTPSLAASPVKIVTERASDEGTETDSPSSAERMVDALLCQALCERASDIHISPERNSIRMQLRIDGKLREMASPPPEQVLPMIARIKLLAGMNITVNMSPQDGRFTQIIPDAEHRRKEMHIRVSCLPTLHGENVVLRLLDADSACIRTLADLGVSPHDEILLRSAIHKPHGMILAVGPTGSGKSTTLHSLLQLRNTPDTNIITLEDPVEYRVDGIRQAQLNPRAGMTFASGLRAILRQDPDIIMVGEIRDDETASIAVQAALTGHLVLSTLHTNDAPGAITRLLDMGVAPYRVASVLHCVVAQRLVRTLCPHCSTAYLPSPEERAAFPEHLAPEMPLHKGLGCACCHHTGYRGRIGLFEVMPIIPKMREAITSRTRTDELARIARTSNMMRSLIADASDKIRNGLTTLEEVVKVIMPEESTLY